MMRNLLTGVASAMQWTLDMAHACLDDVWGVDTHLRGFWAYMLDTFHWSVVKIFLPFLVLTSSYAALCGLFYWLEHVVRWEWLMKYKIQKDKSNSEELIKKCVKQLLWNYFVVVFPLYSLSFSLMQEIGFDIRPETIPSWWVIVLQMAFFLFVEDMVHYWFHRLMHKRWLYKNVHSMHHEFTAPSAMASTYAHPIEVLVLGFGTFAGPFILRCHFLVMVLWANVRQLASIDTHSGFNFPFAPSRFCSLIGGSEFHDFHHRTFNGAFSSNFTWWDKWFKTDGGFFAHKAREARRQQRRQQQAQEQTVQDCVQEKESSFESGVASGLNTEDDLAAELSKP